MRKIVCELCEGMEFTKDGDSFVCSGCGTRYSAAEARNMMRDVDGAAVPVDNSRQQQIDNLLTLARQALSAGNNKEAEGFCNKILEMDAACYEAWLLKGSAAGWQSTIGNNRFNEAVNAFIEAYKLVRDADADVRKFVRERVVSEVDQLGNAIMSLHKKRFSQDPSEQEEKSFKSDHKVIVDGMLSLILQADCEKNLLLEPDKIFETHINFSRIMDEAAVSGLSMAKNAWAGVEKPNEKDWETYIDWCMNCGSLIKIAIIYGEKDTEGNITRWQHYINSELQPMDAKYYWWDGYGWATGHLADSAKSSRRKEVREAEQKIKRLRERLVEEKAERTRKEEEERRRQAEERRKAEEARKARIKAYWDAHIAEKEALESEKAQLETRQDEIAKELADLKEKQNAKTPAEEEIRQLTDQVYELDTRRSRLGIFSGKEKKRLAGEIEELQGRIEALRPKAKTEKAEKDAPIERKMAELNAAVKGMRNRVLEIQAEFEKDRE